MATRPFFLAVAVLPAILLCLAALSAQAELRTSEKSITICQKTTPSLERELADLDVGLGSPIFIRIFKKSRELEVWVQPEPAEEYRLFKTYEICTFSGGLGPKIKEGDERSPEGFYSVGDRQLNPNSQYHLSFDIGYPNAYDKLLGRTGSALMIHGDCISVGCFAMTDSRIEEIYTMAEKALRNGQHSFQVHIFPFRMTTASMKKHKKSKWLAFWKNLKEGYDFFEETHTPPKISVAESRYVFAPDYPETAKNQRKKTKLYN
ncbi:MAG: murein L,D-transpeptidase [Deltaproteobacteria bacterium]|nr:murein L,D-transpeptidase [Deltaproteobacteria bacterium]